MNDIEELRARVAVSDRHYAAGQLQEAKKILIDMVAEGPVYFRPYHNLGFYHWLAAEYGEAVRHLTRAVQIAPKHVESHLLLGKALCMTRDFVPALQHLRAYRENLPGDPHGALWEIRALWGVGKPVEAAYATRSAAEAMDWYAPSEQDLDFAEEPWFLTHIGSWKKHLAPAFGAVSRALEIGCMEGMSAIWIVQHLLKPDGRLDVNDIIFRPRFRENIRRAGIHERLHLLEGPSEEVLPHLPERRYDFIYVDGEHSSSGVFRDCVNAFVLARPGAFIILDDYGKANEGTARGIDLFLRLFGQFALTVAKDYQIVLQRNEAEFCAGQAEIEAISANLSFASREFMGTLAGSAIVAALRSGAAKLT